MNAACFALTLRLRTSLALLGLAACTLLEPRALCAGEVRAFDAPETLRVEGFELTRNGMGVRRATRFFITADIYVAALYVAERSSNARRILDSPLPKQINLQYRYAIDRDDMRRAWQYSFDKNCPAEDCSDFEAPLEQFLTGVRGVAPGDLYIYRFFEDRSEIVQPSGETLRISGGEFARLLLSTWIGAVPPSEEIKAALLAQSSQGTKSEGTKSEGTKSERTESELAESQRSESETATRAAEGVESVGTRR